MSRLGPSTAALGGDFDLASLAGRGGKIGATVSGFPAQRSARDARRRVRDVGHAPARVVHGSASSSSFAAATAADLGSATLLAMTPPGILSTALITPLVPVFDANKHPVRDWRALRANVEALRALAAAFAATAFVAAVATPLAAPAIRVAFEALRRVRRRSASTALVANAFATYVLGGFFFVARELITRVFYVLGDAAAPFRIAAASVFVNAALDVAFVLAFGLGARGVALATAGTAVVAAAALRRAARAEDRRRCAGRAPRRAGQERARGARGVLRDGGRARRDGGVRARRVLESRRRAGGGGGGGAAFAGAALALRLENPLSRASLES